MSPGVFTAQSTPSTEEKKPFRWSIEHIAELHPADIDEMPVYQQITPDKEVEERAQKAIDNFFSTNLIAPSPWNSNAKGSGAKHLVETPLKALEPDLQGSIQKQLPYVKKIPVMQDASAQTMLSLPTDFDLKEVLGEYMICDDADNQENLNKKDANKDVLSTSLRRRLFFHPDNSSFAISPVKTAPVMGEDVDFIGCSSPQVLSANQVEVPVQQATPLKPPTRSHFSSSPIKNVKGLQTPECSDKQQQREFFISPELSPIGKGRFNLKRSSGLFSPHEKIFGEHTVQKNMSAEFAESLSSPEVSPIKMGATPKMKTRSKLSFDSPGFSPISANPGIIEDDQGSFIQEPQPDFPSDDSDVEINTPLASDNQSHSKPTTTRKISHLARRGQRNILHEFEDTAMDFEPNLQPSKHIRFADDIKTSSMLHTKDYSMVDIEGEDHGIAPNSTNQDTGYQTASLQSTNHDTGLTSSQTNPFSVTSNSDVPPSTNLTSLFSKLPLDSVPQHSTVQIDFPEFTAKDFEPNALTSQVPGFEDSSVFSLGQKPLIEQILDVTNPEQFGHAPYNEEEILERARQVLDLVNRLYPEVKSSGSGGDPEEEDLTSMIMNKTGLSLLHELEPIVSSTPQKENRGEDPDTVAASERALAILKQAGEDLAKFGHMLSSIKTSMDKSSVPTMPS